VGADHNIQRLIQPGNGGPHVRVGSATAASTLRRRQAARSRSRSVPAHPRADRSSPAAPCQRGRVHRSWYAALIHAVPTNIGGTACKTRQLPGIRAAAATTVELRPPERDRIHRADFLRRALMRMAKPPAPDFRGTTFRRWSSRRHRTARHRTGRSAGSRSHTSE
jgi:hypothetical protein